MAAVVSEHVVNEHVVNENEVNENLYNLDVTAKEKMSRRSLRRILKPLLKLLKKQRLGKKTLLRKSRRNLEHEVFTEEVDNQNNCNEALEQRLLQDLKDADEGAAITVCLDGQMTVVPVIPGQCYVPVHFAHTHAGDFYWTTLSLEDRDFCYKERAFSQHQVPEMQVA